jgi:hypothetical protein
MAPIDPASRKQVRRPAGCESHLTRRQAAALLGFASEFRIREFERQGFLHSVRGPMHTAFYARPDVLALKARLAQAAGQPQTEWTDADLIAFLEHPSAAGQRTALDLVTEARISIERAERVYSFWSRVASAPPSPIARVSQARVMPESEATPEAPAGHESPTAARLATGRERRGEERRSRDCLIRELRDPDPRVRQYAFERLRAGRSSSPG